MFTKKTVQAREKLVAALRDYYDNNGHASASALVQARYKIQHDAGATVEDIARMELMVPLALLSNSVPGCFWLLTEIVARPSLLADIRDEITQNTLHEEALGVLSMNLENLRDRCPLLLSTFQEVLRMHSVSPSVRLVYNDVLLDDQYLLKKGEIVQIPSGMLHYREDIWGLEASEFEPKRFMRPSSPQSQKQELANDAHGTNEKKFGPTDARAFIPFGFAPHICPGRHFATGEILSLLAMLVVRYDIVPEEGQRWLGIEKKEAVAGTMMLPKKPFNVTIKTRPGYESKKWTYKLDRGSSGRFALITG